MTVAPASRMVIRLPNWVGDAVMCLPAIHTLLALGYQLDLFGRAWAIDLLAGLPCHVHVLPKGLFAAAKTLRKHPAAMGVVFPNSFSSALMMRLSGKRVVGYRSDGRRWLLNVPVSKQLGCHEVEVFWQLARVATQALGDERWPDALPNTLDLPCLEAATQEAAVRLSDQGVPDQFVVLCPQAVGTLRGQSKIWPYWRACCEALQAQGVCVVSCPGPGEVTQTQADLPGAVILEDTSLQVCAAVLSRATAVLANDSGLMHVAAAVNHKAVGIFAPFAVPGRTRPWGGEYVHDPAHWPSVEVVLDRLKQVSGLAY